MISAAAPHFKPVLPPPDWTDLTCASRELERCVRELCGMTDAVANARQIKEYDSDRRKRALSVAMASIADPASNADAEHRARASVGYSDAMKRLAHEYTAAERVLLAYEAAKIKSEALRTIISLHKHIAGNI